jgi:hypothetical protein
MINTHNDSFPLSNVVNYKTFPRLLSVLRYRILNITMTFSRKILFDVRRQTTYVPLSSTSPFLCSRSKVGLKIRRSNFRLFSASTCNIRAYRLLRKHGPDCASMTWLFRNNAALLHRYCYTKQNKIFFPALASIFSSFKHQNKKEELKLVRVQYYVVAEEERSRSTRSTPCSSYKELFTETWDF